MPEWEKGRYISLLGDPIGRDGKPESLRTSFYKVADVQGSGLATSLSVIFDEVMQSPVIPDPNMLDVALANILYIAISRGFESAGKGSPFGMGVSIGFTKGELEKKCIDTRPDQKTVPTLDKYEFSAKEVRNSYLKLCTILLGMNCLTIPSLAVTSPLSAANQLLMQASLATRAFTGYRRFNKVVTGEHVIVDMPKPKPVEEKIGKLAFAGMSV